MDEGLRSEMSKQGGLAYEWKQAGLSSAERLRPHWPKVWPKSASDFGISTTRPPARNFEFYGPAGLWSRSPSRPWRPLGDGAA